MTRAGPVSRWREGARSLARGARRRLGGLHAYHHMGTCRIGHDPARNVTDGDLRLHGSPNLYIVGSAVFVTGGAANPTLTIVAQSHRLADHLHARPMGAPRVAPARTSAPALPG